MPSTFAPTKSRAVVRRLATAVACAILTASSAHALHRETPGAVRIAPAEHSRGRSWGRYLAFASVRNLTDPAPVGRQIYVFNHFHWVCQRGKPEPATFAMCPNPPVPFIVRVTSGPGAPDRPSVSDAIDVDGDGVPDSQWLAYEADGSHNGSTGCEATRRQIFLKELYTGELRQITFACDGDSTNPTLSYHGGLLAFQSTGTIMGPTSPPGVPQIYTYARGELALRKVTAGAGPSTNPMTNKTGTRVVFQSTADLLGSLANVGTSQIFWAEYNRRNHTTVLHQLTNGNGSSENAYSAEDAPFVLFDSVATDLPGAFSPGGRQVFIARVDAEPVPDLPPVTQLTTAASFGACSFPTIDPANVRVAFVCTGDPSPLGSPGSRVFAFDLADGRLFSVSTAIDVAGPIALSTGQWFVTLATSFDLTGLGECGRQLHIVDYYAGPQDGNTVIGERKFTLMAGDAVGASQGALTTRDGTLAGRFLDPGGIDMLFGAPDEFTGEAPVDVPAGYFDLPPIPIRGVGAFCVRQTGPGTGVLDCDGSKAGYDVATWQDHYTDDTDPMCLLGCREDDPECNNALLPGPHRVECPRCVLAEQRCNNGPYAGAVCASDADCRVGMEACQDETVENAMCNGPLMTELTGEFAAGGLRLTMPMEVSLSAEIGPDDAYCTADDVYDPYFGARTLEPTLRLTTGVSTSRVLDTDGVQGAPLGISNLGAPLECSRLRAGDLEGARLVAALPLLDAHLPNRPLIQDAIMSLRLEAKPGVVDTCSTPCTADVECNDLDACNGIETCAGGFCTAGVPVVCDDGDACNGVESCVPSTGQCLSGTPPLCDDGNPCNGGETCDPVLGCVEGLPVECSDGDPCNGFETCNPLNGECLAGIPLCDDLDPCNGVETCDRLTATCKAGIPVECDDGNPCNGVESCDPNTGSCDVATPALCDDLNPCNGIELCNPSTGECAAGTPPECDDGNPCTIDSCDTTHGCDYAPKCDDGNQCNGVESCDIVEVCDPGTGACSATGLCSPGVPFDCDDGDPCTIDSCDIDRGCLSSPACGDGNLCNGVEVCDAGTGACGAGVPLGCDDGNPCTDDSCDALLGCVHVNNTASCDDGDLCTTGDVCHLGVCGGVEVVCTDGDACNGLELCDPGTGTCLAGTPLECDDANPCTDDSCDPVRGCIETNNDLPCDDGLICTTADQCQAGICTGAPLCDDGDACNGTETCDPGTGTCGVGAPLVCDDGNPCTDDSCEAAVGCRTRNNTLACDDGTLCTFGDVCTNGVCVGTSVGCDDGDACNGSEGCDPATGTCLSGVVPTCDDGVGCTVDLCVPAEGCTNTPVDTGIPGVLCLLDAMEASVTGPPPLAYRSDTLQARLLRVVNNAQRKMERALAGANRTRPLLGGTRRLMNRFKRRVQKAELRLRIERDYGDHLMEMADATQEILYPLIHTNAPLTTALLVGESTARRIDEMAGAVSVGPTCAED